MPRMQTDVPARKVNVAALGAAISTLGVWALTEFTGLMVPEPVAVAVVTIVTFLLGYFVPPAERDGLLAEPTEEEIPALDNGGTPPNQATSPQ